MKRVCILGDGAWGTAIAMVLADNGHDVILWCHNVDVAYSIAHQARNMVYLPDIILDTSRIHATTDLGQALHSADWIIEAIPVAFMRSVIEQAKEYVQPQHKWVILSKGIEQDTLYMPSQVIDDVMGYLVRKAIVTGPSFAKDLAKKQVTAVIIAADDCVIGNELCALLTNDYFRPYLSLDPIGAQLGGALKNCIAIGIGILDGAGYTDNVKAFFLTRGLHEMVTLSLVLGGTIDTLYDLAGVGDLVLTTMGSHSKNVAVGKMLGAGSTLQELKQKLPTLPEGINTIASMCQLVRQHNLSLPLLTAVYDVVFSGESAQHLVDVLVRNSLVSAC